MSGSLAGYSHDEVTHAVEKNLAAFITAYCAINQGETHESPGLTWVYSGMKMAYFNSVVECHLSADEAETVVPALLADYRARPERALWWVTATTTPGDMSARLQRHGCAFAWRDTGMAMDMAMLPVAPDAPDLSITPLSNPDEIHAWLDIYGVGYQLSRAVRDDYGSILTRILADHPEIGPYYLAHLEGQPAGIASLFCSEGVAGIYEVATLPAMRRRGLGYAVTLAALREARARGCRLAVLQASSGGFPVYERIGFRTFGYFDAYSV